MTLQRAKENFIIDVATKLFFENSIFNVTIKDIAKEAGVGEMTVYRYFGKKQNIVLAVAVKLEQEILSFFDLSDEKTGFDKIKVFYNSYLKIFKKSPKHYTFIRDFDTYMIDFKDEGSLEGYEKGIDAYKKMFFEAYELGLQDGSIKPHENIETFYYASTHSLLELCKKMSYEGLLSQDDKIIKYDEIHMLIDVFLESLSISK